MLVLITLAILMSYKIVINNTKITSNNQTKAELYAANNLALDLTINDVYFLDGEPLFFSVNQYQIDSSRIDPESGAVLAQNEDTVADANIDVKVTSSCVKSHILANKDAFTVDTQCVWDPDSGGVFNEGQSSGGNFSLCAKVLWDLQASSKDPYENTLSAQTHEGVEVTTDRSLTAATVCNP